MERVACLEGVAGRDGHALSTGHGGCASEPRFGTIDRTPQVVALYELLFSSCEGFMQTIATS